MLQLLNTAFIQKQCAAKMEQLSMNLSGYASIIKMYLVYWFTSQ